MKFAYYFKYLIISFVLLLVPMSLAAQNSSKYEAPLYFPERPYDGIVGAVDSMVTYTFETAKIHKDSLLKTQPAPGKCIGVKRQYFDQNGRRNLLEILKLNDQDTLMLDFREITWRDSESYPTSRTITQDGITTHYLLQSRENGTEVYKAISLRGYMPPTATGREMTVVYEYDPAEFDMEEGQIETEMNINVTTIVEEADGRQTITIDNYSEEGFCGSTRIIKKDKAGNQIYDSHDVTDNNIGEGIVSYTMINKEDERGNYLVLNVFDGKDILQAIEMTEFFYREGDMEVD